MREVGNNLPQHIEDLFEAGENSYYFNTEEALDNVGSLLFFLEWFDGESYVEQFDETQCFLSHMHFDFELQLDSGGVGGFNSHVITVTKI